SCRKAALHHGSRVHFLALLDCSRFALIAVRGGVFKAIAVSALCRRALGWVHLGKECLHSATGEPLERTRMAPTKLSHRLLTVKQSKRMEVKRRISPHNLVFIAGQGTRIPELAL